MAGWVLAGRLTGLLRVVTAAAVLGPTYLGNGYQGLNTLPNLTYEFLTGSLLVSVLVPPLVRLLDGGAVDAAERFAGAVLGFLLLIFTLAALAFALCGPLLLRAFSAGVPNPAAAAQQRSAGALLLVLMMPQVVFYGVAAVGNAALNARGRFALAAAAPAFENLVVTAVLATVAVVWGTGRQLDASNRPLLLTLGLGSTAAVALHASVQWAGAWRAGVRLVPNTRWRDPQCRELLSRIGPSFGYAALNAVRNFLVLVVVNRIPGGVVAFQLAFGFYGLPVAVGARPIAVAILPRLSRLWRSERRREYDEELAQALRTASLITVPSAVALVALAVPLAHAVALGSMGSSTGIRLVAVAVASMGTALVGEAVFIIFTHASYAREDATAPFTAMLARTGVSVAGMAVAASFLDGPGLMAGVGMTYAAANAVGAVCLGAALARGKPSKSSAAWPSYGRALLASLIMVIPATVVAFAIPQAFPAFGGWLVAVLLASLVGLAAYIAMQRRWRSAELEALLAALPYPRRGRRP